ncbi:hypothetical protein LVJ82_11105 [Vitreoscilla massiliensis]|uniref:Uncharacterized protein n=1 Tax=Vitreoscilla massiliensis TaxID=1689272 RepID=A0ABY4DXK4_9NEIS|nr:hypothetical protein [Vitreoscilla massiliensis]UOO88037.1 hypothetical protein LVJ82_11105 [Vitreoscilla massiliensis]
MYPKWMIGIVLLLLMHSSWAHRDTKIDMDKQGILSVPAEFGTVKLKLKGLGKSKKSVVFSVNEQQTQVPACLVNLIRSEKAQDVRIRGSWYHETGSLPYYVTVEFYTPAQIQAQQSMSADMSLMFNLNNAELMFVNQVKLSKTPIDAICQQIQDQRQKQKYF